MDLAEIQNQFMQAIKDGDLEYAQRLREEGAQIEFVDAHGFTALSAAVRAKNIPSIRWLLGYHANVNHVGTVTSATPLAFAVSGRCAAAVEALLACPDINVNLDVHGNTPLLMCTKDFGPEPVEIVKMLLDANADPNCKDIFGKTALQYAKDNNRVEIARLLKKKIREIKRQEEADARKPPPSPFRRFR